MRRILPVLALLLLLLALAISQECSSQDQEFMVSFHPHLDAFWLNTDDELKSINFRPAGFLYAMNQRNSKTLLNSAFQALKQDPSRKYFITEVVFFKDWYDYLDEAKRKQVKQLIQRGQFQVANGGWVQNDEAVCYMDDILDQYTLGSTFLEKEFGVHTRIGWATDNFGNSHSQVALQHLLGFEFQEIERVDDRYIYDRNGGSLLEFYWQPVSDSNNRKYGGVVTLVRHFLHEVNDLRRQQPMSIVRDFTRLSDNMKKLYHQPKLFRFLGNDFEEFIPDQFSKLEKALSELNKDSRSGCKRYKYGNPTDYLDAIKGVYNESNLPTREYDLMANYDQDHYWTGFYTSNPDLKKMCKDFSRIVNLYRKVMVTSGRQTPEFRNSLVQADELLSVMQHHDGITATSKLHIMNKMKQRMEEKTNDLVKAISLMKGLPQQSCLIYQDKCVVSQNEAVLYLTIVHMGVSKRERVELQLASNLAYDVQTVSNDQIFCHPRTNRCHLVFEAELGVGDNVFKLNKIDGSRNIQATQRSANAEGEDFQVSIQGSKIEYTHRGDFIKLGLVKVNNRHSSTQTYTWDKYGNQQKKGQSRMAGLYIMANEGRVSEIRDMAFNDILVAKGEVYTKIYALLGTKEYITITLNNRDKTVLDVETFFKPPNRDMADYFIQIESSVQSHDEFYHDASGYLVSRRKIAWRPDYKWDYKSEDKINANTFPMCSFFYAIQGDRKMVVFTDRAQGVTQYDNTYLINIDRIAGDDYKGVGQGYFEQKALTYKHRIAIVSKESYPEREWQRSYDEALVGYISSEFRESVLFSKSTTDNSRYLKHTIFSINKNEFIIRLFNLAETETMAIRKYRKEGWTIPEIGLQMAFADIKETFANGLPMTERRVWKTIPGEINTSHRHSKDTDQQLILEPLQIRTFRINKTGLVVENPTSKKQSTLKNIIRSAETPLKNGFKKRCF